MTQGRRTSLRMTPGFSSAAYPENWSVWIDYNRDGDFTDAGEHVFAGGGTPSTVQSIFDVPQTAKAGATRMRVGMSYQSIGAGHSSGDIQDGEFEDYTALIYCDAHSRTYADEWIAEVNVGEGSLVKVSGPANYSDFTASSIAMRPMTCVPTTFTPGYSAYNYAENWRVWVDFNQDGDFDDHGEAVWQSAAAIVGPAHGQICVPANAKPGRTRMRVQMSYEPDGATCGSFEWGEVEDYSIDIERDPA